MLSVCDLQCDLVNMKLQERKSKTDIESAKETSLISLLMCVL